MIDSAKDSMMMQQTKTGDLLTTGGID